MYNCRYHPPYIFFLYKSLGIIWTWFLNFEIFTQRRVIFASVRFGCDHWSLDFNLCDLNVDFFYFFHSWSLINSSNSLSWRIYLPARDRCPNHACVMLGKLNAVSEQLGKLWFQECWQNELGRALREHEEWKRFLSHSSLVSEESPESKDDCQNDATFNTMISAREWRDKFFSLTAILTKSQIGSIRWWPLGSNYGKYRGHKGARTPQLWSCALDPGIDISRKNVSGNAWDTLGHLPASFGPYRRPCRQGISNLCEIALWLVRLFVKYAFQCPIQTVKLPDFHKLLECPF